MRADVLILCLIVGLCTWAFRVLPARLNLGDLPPQGFRARFLAATGPAAIATLFTASVLPTLTSAQAGTALPLMAGTGTVLAAFVASRSVVGATLAGAAGYGTAFWLQG